MAVTEAKNSDCSIKTSSTVKYPPSEFVPREVFLPMTTLKINRWVILGDKGPGFNEPRTSED